MEDNIKTAILQGYSNYIIYEDGRIYSKRWNRFLRTTPLFNGAYRSIRMFSDDGILKVFYIHDLLKRCFGVKVPEIVGEQHRPIKGYEGLYEIYTNGEIYSYIRCHFLKPTYYGYNKYISLKTGKQKKTFKIAKLVLDNFSKDCNWKNKKEYKIIFKDNNKSNCNINNLIVVRKKEHESLHKVKNN